MAKQFEALFLNMMLKSMREAVPKEDPLETESTRLYTGMLDQEWAQRLAEKGIGLADVMVRQLSLAEGDAARTAPSDDPLKK